MKFSAPVRSWCAYRIAVISKVDSIVTRSRSLALDFDAGPFLADFGHRGEVRCAAIFDLGDIEHGARGRAHHHRHAHPFGLVEAEAHVLERQLRGEAEVEG